jgi:hypothetical protein
LLSSQKICSLKFLLISDQLVFAMLFLK